MQYSLHPIVDDDNFVLPAGKYCAVNQPDQFTSFALDHSQPLLFNVTSDDQNHLDKYIGFMAATGGDTSCLVLEKLQTMDGKVLFNQLASTSFFGICLLPEPLVLKLAATTIPNILVGHVPFTLTQETVIELEDDWDLRVGALRFVFLPPDCMIYD